MARSYLAHKLKSISNYWGKWMCCCCGLLSWLSVMVTTGLTPGWAKGLHHLRGRATGYAAVCLLTPLTRLVKKHRWIQAGEGEMMRWHGVYDIVTSPCVKAKNTNLEDLKHYSCMIPHSETSLVCIDTKTLNGFFVTSPPLHLLLCQIQ